MIEYRGSCQCTYTLVGSKSVFVKQILLGKLKMGHSEPAGQIASREMEIVRIKGALQRAEELSDDVAAAIEQVV